MIPEQLIQLATSLSKELWVKKLFSKANVYLVGGSVRDAFLNMPIKDVDLVVEGLTLSSIKELLSPLGKVDIVGESFSVLKFKPHDHTGEAYDIATPRIDLKVGKGHKGFHVITDGITLKEDLQRRDFTINSMAFDLFEKRLIDPFNGSHDLRKKLLRATDTQAFVEDPLRILRGIQFASRFGFDIEPTTLKLMQRNAHLIRDISGERIFDELSKIVMKKGSTQRALDLIHSTDVDKALFGKKMLRHEELDNLDPLSFYYVLGLLGDVSPSDFVRKRLKGDNRIEKGLRVLDSIIKEASRIDDEEELHYVLFKAFNAAPIVMNAVVLPANAYAIAQKMENEEIPSSEEDIAINGNDIKEVLELQEGPDVGKIKQYVIKDALMNRFDWKNRNKALEYLTSLK